MIFHTSEKRPQSIKRLLLAGVNEKVRFMLTCTNRSNFFADTRHLKPEHGWSR
jgi:hypothetical protein